MDINQDTLVCFRKGEWYLAICPKYKLVATVPVHICHCCTQYTVIEVRVGECCVVGEAIFEHVTAEVEGWGYPVPSPYTL